MICSTKRHLRHGVVIQIESEPRIGRRDRELPLHFVETPAEIQKHKISSQNQVKSQFKIPSQVWKQAGMEHIHTALTLCIVVFLSVCDPI